MYNAGFDRAAGCTKRRRRISDDTGDVQKRRAGNEDSYAITDCELGVMVARTKRGICSVTFGADNATLLDALEKEFPNAEIAEDAEDLKTAVDAILKYLEGKTKRLVLPLDLQATAFQMQVWDFLRKIPYGETRSYSQVAEALGDKKKVRAVAQACAKNRVAVVIPCHRVVASDGKLSGYRWGVERKRRLLEREAAEGK